MAEAVSLARPQTDHLSTLARTVSDLFSPAALSIPCLLLGVASSDVPGTYWYALLYFAIAVPMPVLYILWMIKTGRADDFHLPNRRDRFVPFVIAIASAVLGVVLLAYLGSPSELMAPIVASMLLTAALFLITLVWQISIHAAGTAGLATYAVLMLGAGGAVCLLFVPLVTWARLHLERHTLAQTTAGSVLGCAIFVGLFALRGIVW